jgi:hypothetical protein
MKAKKWTKIKKGWTIRENLQWLNDLGDEDIEKFWEIMRILEVIRLSYEKKEIETDIKLV